MALKDCVIVIPKKLGIRREPYWSFEPSVLILHQEILYRRLAARFSIMGESLTLNSGVMVRRPKSNAASCSLFRQIPLRDSSYSSCPSSTGLYGWHKVAPAQPSQ